jgi:osmotically-inducible protein OsmY
LRQTIEQRLASRSISGVQVVVDGNNVTLCGVVRSLWEKNQAREEAWRANERGEVFDRLTVVQGVADQQILEEVLHGIYDHVFYTIFDQVEVEVLDGIVTLTGDVDRMFKPGVFAEGAARTTGVLAVRNKIRWLGISNGDAYLRDVLARRLYGDALFWHDAVQPRPSIHIIVKAGRVKLLGAVDSEEHRRAALRIVRETGGVLSCENKLRLKRERIAL